MASQTATLTKQLTPLPGLKSMWEDSQDIPCGTLGPFYECWTVKGLAREVFNKIADGIKSILESSADELEEARQGPPYPLGWTMYMIGYRKLRMASAHPTLVFECMDRRVRATAKVIIGRHQIWRDAVLAYPGLKLAHSARGPQLCAGVGDTPAFVGRSSKSPRRKEEGQSMHSPSTLSPDEFRPDVIPAYLSAREKEWDSLRGDIEILGERGVETPCGAPIHIKVKSTSLTREATLGGTVFINGRTYGLTVAHAFTSSMQAPEISSESEIDDDLCFDDDDDEDRSEVDPTAVLYAAHEEEKSFRTTHHKVPRTESSASLLRPTVYSFETSARGGSRTNLGRLCMASTGRGEGLDWAVISIEDGQYRGPNIIRKSGLTPFSFRAITRVASDSPKNVRVLAVAVRGHIPGSISGTPYYLGISGSRCFEKCWTVCLEEPISTGDCGSWVIDIETGEWIGHIVARQSGSTFAYIVPAQKIMADIKTRFGHEPSLLPTSTDQIEARKIAYD